MYYQQSKREHWNKFQVHNFLSLLSNCFLSILKSVKVESSNALLQGGHWKAGHLIFLYWVTQPVSVSTKLSLICDIVLLHNHHHCSSPRWMIWRTAWVIFLLMVSVTELQRTVKLEDTLWWPNLSRRVISSSKIRPLWLDQAENLIHAVLLATNY